MNMTASLDDAWVHHRAGRLEQASDVYFAILRAQPERADVLHLLGNVEYQREHLHEARQLIARAIELDPASPVYRISLGHALRRQGQLTAAEDCYRAALALRPDSVLAAVSLVKVLTESEQLEPAVALLQRVLILDPQHLEALSALGNLWLQLERPLAAAQMFRQALAMTPDNADIRFALGVAASQQGDASTAIECFEAALRLRPEFAEACYNLGVIESEAQKLASAEAWFRRALSVRPLYIDAQINLSAVLLKAGRDTEAKIYRDQAYKRQCVFVRSSRAARRTVLVLFDAGKGNVNLSHLFARQHNNLIDWMIEYAPADQALPPFDLVFNAMGDQGITGATAQPVAQFLARCAKPVLNQPDAVERTARDRIFDLLGDIDGLYVPRTRRVENVADVEVNAEQFPLLARPLDSHGGMGLQLLQEPAQLSVLKRSARGPLYLTPFCDFRSADGHYRKYRFIFIDRKPLPYHLAISPHWLVHYATADMLGTPWKLEEELRFLADPAAAIGARAYAAVEAIGRRIDLDYAGMDFSLLPDGRILLFEANPVMLVHPESAGGELDHKNVFVSNIFAAFESMLARRMTSSMHA